MRIIALLIVIFAIFIQLDKKIRKKAYDFSSLYAWILYTVVYISLIYKGRNIPIIIIPLLLLVFLNKQLSAPIDFCLNSVFTLVTSRNRENTYKMCKNLFVNNTQFINNLSVIPKKPTIWILNYPKKNWIEYYTQSLLPQNYVFIVNKKFGGILSNYYGTNRVYSIDFSKRDNYGSLKRVVQKILTGGLNVCMYFDTKVDYKGVKKYTYTLQTARTGIFHIAKELDRDITPIVMDHLYISNGIIPLQNFEIYVGNPTKIKTQKDIDNTILFFKNKLKSFMTNKFRL